MPGDGEIHGKPCATTPVLGSRDPIVTLSLRNRSVVCPAAANIPPDDVGEVGEYTGEIGAYPGEIGAYPGEVGAYPGE